MARQGDGWRTEPPRARPGGLLARLARALFGRRPATAPGAVVWAPVRYRDRPWESKDRPVLVVGSDGGHLLVLTLTSRPRDPRHREWLDAGTGTWDARRRRSWVRLHPYYRLEGKQVRRYGGKVPAETLAVVRRELETRYGWPAG